MDIAQKARIDRDWLTARAQQLIEDDCDIDPAENLVLYGLDSIAVMTFSAELKQMGVTDFFVVQESGANHFAISLGVFSSEGGARDRLDALKGQGVRSAKVGPRSGKGEVVTLQARGDQDAVGAAKSSAAKALPNAQTASCG